MALPDITPPAGLPCFLAEGHAIELMPAFANVERTSGHVRRRRVWTTAPRVQTVGWVLDSDQMQAVHEWYRDELVVGSRHFSAFVMPEGGVGMWWEAVWVEPYIATAMPLGLWRVAGKLRLIGEPSADGPVRTTFRARIPVAAGGAALAGVGRPLRASIAVQAGGGAEPVRPRALAAAIPVAAAGQSQPTTPRRLSAVIEIGVS